MDPMDDDDLDTLDGLFDRYGAIVLFDGLASIADEQLTHVQKLSEEYPGMGYEMKTRQWKRTVPKVRALAEWIAEFGPGSNCR